MRGINDARSTGKEQPQRGQKPNTEALKPETTKKLPRVVLA